MQDLEKVLDMNVPKQIVTITRWNKQRTLNEKLCNKLGNIVSRLKTRFDPQNHKARNQRILKMKIHKDIERENSIE
jgi:hypothetical protein